MKKNHITSEQCEQYISWKKNYEILLHKLFMSDTEIFKDKKDKKKILTLLFCLLYYSITPLQMLLIFKSKNKESSETTFLNRLKEEGYLKSIANKNSLKIFAITKKGMEFCEKTLLCNINETELVENNITQECILFLTKSVQNKRNPINLKHYVGVHNFVASLFCLLNVIYFEIDFETEITQRGQEILSYQRIEKNHTLKKDKRSLLSDGILKFKDIKDVKNAKKIEYIYYLEQDSGTQGKDIIQKKINQYMVNVLEKQAYKNRHPLIFSIYPDIQNSCNCPEKIDTTKFLYARIVSFAAYMCSKFENDISMHDVQMSEIIDCLQSYCSSVEEDNLSCFITFFKNIIKSIEEPSVKNMSFEQYMKHLQIYKEDRKEDICTKNKKNELKSYRMRKKFFRNICDDIYEKNRQFKSYVHCGWSIYCTDSLRNKEIMPFIFFPLVHSDCLKKIMMDYNEIEDKQAPIRYFYDCKNNFQKDQVSFKNVIKYPNGRYYIENLSDDLTSVYRIKMYLNNVSWGGEPGVLLCLVDDENEGFSRNIFMGTKYETCVNQLRNKVPLRIWFIKYSDLKNKNAKMYDFDKDGNVRYRSLVD